MLRGRLAGYIDPSVTDALASAIATHEGWYAGSLSWRNNNPGNLVYAGQAGASPGEGGFAKFATAAAGWQAMKDQINLDVTRGTDAAGNPVTNIAELISSWAPAAAGNNTAAYIASVASQTGLDVNASFDSLSAGDSAAGDGGLFSAGVFSSGIDLSSVGLPSSVPAWMVGGAALLAVALLSR